MGEKRRKKENEGNEKRYRSWGKRKERRKMKGKRRDIGVGEKEKKEGR